jgi:hypothetical protein
MGDWIYRPDLNADWMSLIFLFNLVIILILYKLDSNRLKTLIKIFNLRIYLGKYSNEKELNFFSYFNTFSFFTIIFALSLIYFSFLSNHLIQINNHIEYYYFLLGIFIVLFFRYLLIQFISNKLGFQKSIKLVFYKNFSLATQISIIIIGLVFLWNYSTIPLIFIESILVLIYLYWIINQFDIFFSFFQSRSEDLIYIILYLCAFKLAPWIWIYILLVETKL